MRIVRFLALLTAALTCAAAAGAYRRAAASGQPFGVALRSLAAEWSCPALRERARRAVLDGLQAAELRAAAADRDLADAAPVR